MKKLFILLLLIGNFHTLQAGSDSAIFDLEMGGVFGTLGGKVTTIGNEELLLATMRVGFIMGENQYLILGKDAAVGSTENVTTRIETPAPPALFINSEYLEYEYILDLGFFIDLGFSASANIYYIGDGTSGSGVFFGSEPQIKAIINLTPNVKIQLGYGKRFSTVSDADLLPLTLTKNEVDTQVYAFTLDIGGF